MIVWYCIIALLALWGLKRVPSDATSPNCFSRTQSLALNGVFILLVYVGHVWHLCLQPMGYVPINIFDRFYFFVNNFIGQLCVVTFLFYSGFGVIEQVKVRGLDYVDSMPFRRIFATWVNFATAVAIFALLNIVFSQKISVGMFLAALVCFKTIGNPSWYIFCIICGYFSIYLALKMVNGDLQKRTRIWTMVVLLMGIYTVVVMILKPGMCWWWNTAMVIPFGVVASLYKDEICHLFQRYYWPLLVFSIVMFFLTLRYSFLLRNVGHNAVGFFFIVIILLITYKVKISNGVLIWLGNHLFPIYMYHMLFFLLVRLLYKQSPTQFGALFIVLICFLMSVIMACLYPYWQITLKGKDK